MHWYFEEYAVEAIGWISTAAFIVSIVIPKRIHLHQLGVFTAVTTAIYAYAHDATAIWVKWVIAFFFHIYMWIKIGREPFEPASTAGGVEPRNQ